MLRRYRKIEVDSRFSAAEDRGHYSICGDSAEKQLSFISFYLQNKRSLRKLNYMNKLHGQLHENYMLKRKKTNRQLYVKQIKQNYYENNYQ